MYILSTPDEQHSCALALELIWSRKGGRSSLEAHFHFSIAVPATRPQVHGDLRIDAEAPF